MIIRRDEIKDVLADHVQIVFTNGVFDLFHPGHVQLLTFAGGLGDLVIVGVNSDDSARQLAKGPGQPFYTDEERALMVDSHEQVDFTVIFGEDTPLDLITTIMPDVIVKGAHYSREEVVGSRLARVELCPLAPHSTTNTIARVAANLDMAVLGTAQKALMVELFNNIRRGSCWCELGIGNPMVKGHSRGCFRVRKFFAAIGRECGP